MTRLGIGGAAAFAIGLIAGCGLLPPAPAATPTPCLERFNPLRCQAMTDLAASDLDVTSEEIVRIDVLPEPTPPGGGQYTLGGPPDVDVRVTLDDGTMEETSMHCGGIAEHFNPACQDAPHITVRSIIDGYRDVPAGSTPLPTLEPQALADAVPLHLDRLDIPIDHVGSHEVPIGEARLPNGVVTAAGFDLVDPWPTHVTIIDERGVSLRLRPVDPDSPPFENYYTHGWRPGTERVEVVLVFDVFRFDPGATLSIRDVDVH